MGFDMARLHVADNDCHGHHDRGDVQRIRDRPAINRSSGRTRDQHHCVQVVDKAASNSSLTSEGLKKRVESICRRHRNRSCSLGK